MGKFSQKSRIKLKNRDSGTVPPRCTNENNWIELNCEAKTHTAIAEMKFRSFVLCDIV